MRRDRLSCAIRKRGKGELGAAGMPGRRGARIISPRAGEKRGGSAQAVRGIGCRPPFVNPWLTEGGGRKKAIV